MENELFQPDIHISFLAIGIAVAAHFIFGFIWYTPLFGKAWAKEMGFSMDMEVPKGMLVKNLVINLIGNFLLAWVLAHNIAAWDPHSWGHDSDFMPKAASAIMSAVFTWIGFFIPQGLNDVTWGMKSWKLFFINTSYHLLMLLIVSFILVFVK